jgi:hypothetical protein
MAYIIKNTAGLINTRLTDVGRRNLSQGNFNISYFQIGDSEVSYSAVTNYNQVNNNILMPAFNAQNDTGSPQSNKENIKYPYYVSGQKGNTYGLPFMDSAVQVVYNSAGPKGFFSASTQGNWTPQTTSNQITGYTVNSNFVVDMTTLSGTTNIYITHQSPECAPSTGTPSVNDFVTIILDDNGGCVDFGTYPVLTYRIQSMNPPNGTTGTTGYTLTLDRAVPNYTGVTLGGQTARVLIYPSGMTQIYDTVTPASYWEIDTLNFESPCDVVNRENTLIWNMNIPWSVNPAGFQYSAESYSNFGSVSYIGTKEYLGYQEPSGQTDTSQVYYYNSFDEKVIVTPKQQKAIAIIHYTNQDIDNVYGEKFATVPFDPQNPIDNQPGLARKFKLTLPTLMWHKSTGSSIGETFWIDPPDYDLCYPYYIKSKVNTDMNDPGIRYYHLWDTNPDDNGNLNRIGKVFPDQQTVIIDDEEIVAAMSNKSNRNWTLPAPKLSLLTPNTCFTNNGTATGVFSGATQKMYVTYRLDSTGNTFTNSLHCNYYSLISADSSVTANTQNIAIRFGAEFPFLNDDFGSTNLTGFCANSIKLLVQMVEGDVQPNPISWYPIDVTDEFSSTMQNGYLTQSGLTGTTLQISLSEYQTAIAGPAYNLGDYINLTPTNNTEILNFGDEFYFYGNLETDIAATIYEMRYLVTLGRNQFTNTSNPTWVSGTTSYVTEIGLFDSNKDLMVISKLQSPELRQGIQQYIVKLDF